MIRKALQAARMEVHHDAPTMHVAVIREGHKDVTARRNEEEDVEKTLERLSKKLKAKNCTLHHEDRVITNLALHEALSGDGRFLEVDQLRLPVHYNPPKIASIELSSKHPFVGVPMTAKPVCYTKKSPFEFTYEWSVDGKIVCKDAVFTPNETSNSVVSARITPHSECTTGVTATIETMDPILDLPSDLINKQESWVKKPNEMDIRVCTYNLLADQYAAGTDSGREAYSHVALPILTMGYRSQAILSDILKISPDIISLQEVGHLHYKRLRDVLSWFGWDGWFELKLKANEGCAVFWKQSRFRMVFKEALPLGGTDLNTIPFPQSVKLAVENCKETTETFSYVVSILQYAEFKDITADKLFGFCNTHLFYHPTGGCIRLAQLAAIYNYVSLRGQGNSCIISGDLNTVARQFPINTDLSDDSISWRCDKYKDVKTMCVSKGNLMLEDERVTSLSYEVATGILKVNRWEGRVRERYILNKIASMGKRTGFAGVFPDALPATASYRFLCGDTISCSDRDMMINVAVKPPFVLENPNEHLEFTCHSPKFTEVLDYTLFSLSTFSLSRIMPAYDFASVRARITGFPTDFNPSDHIPVYVDLSYQVS